MASQGDLQELLRIFTSRRATMMQAMGHVKALQAKNLRSLKDVSEAPLADVEAAVGDAKLAKSVHTACKAHGKKSAPKRSGPDDGDVASPPAKKPKVELHKRDLDYSSMSPDELESALGLPLCEEEALIRETAVVTNRAPLMLAFVAELLRFTMREQPPSSRLSLAQGVVSANSRTKAVSIGIEKAPTGMHGHISEGQPKVRIMGREIAVLKRGGYSWSESQSRQDDASRSVSSSATLEAPQNDSKLWYASQTLTSRSSTFIAHVAPMSSPSGRAKLLRTLMLQKPDLETATHNAWAVRVNYKNSPLGQEESFDDGESGCGKFLLQVLREANANNMFVVLTRWYGGIMLGPDRWRLMRECVNDALSSQRRTASLSGTDAVWALDVHDTTPAASTVGMAIHRPEAARNYLLRSFMSSSEGAKPTTTMAALHEEKQRNLGLLLGALRLLFASWEGTLRPEELDRRAWSWYVAVRPDVDAGPAGWGAKATLNLGRILDLRRKQTSDKATAS